MDYQSERYDKFLDFSLAIKPYGSNKMKHSLLECIELYLLPELMDGDNKYYAEKYNCKVDAIKGFKFNKLPHILSIQLKRFITQYFNGNIIQKKINEIIKFPILLDMNKYVISNDDDKNERYFDSFVNHHIQSLLEQRRRKYHNHHNNNHNNDVCHNNNDRMMDDDGPPDLVNYDEQPYQEDVTLDSISPSDIVEWATATDRLKHEDRVKALLQKGKWIYELYSVLVHSGATTGGHYFAYIRDVDAVEDVWYKFNDNDVIAVSETVVRDAWGKYESSSNARNAVPGLERLRLRTPSFEVVSPSRSLLETHQSPNTPPAYPDQSKNETLPKLSTTNAYMLMYRRVTSSEERVHFPTDSDVPEYIREEIRQNALERERKRIEDEKRENALAIRILYDEDEYLIHASKLDTLRSLLTQLYHELKLNKIEFLNSYYEINNQIPFEYMRIRQYNSYYNVATEVYDNHTHLESPLRNLQFISNRLYYLEVRYAENLIFEIYPKDGITLLLLQYSQEEATGFMKPICLRLSRTETLGDLRSRVQKYVSYEKEKIRFIRFIENYNSTVSAVELIGDEKIIKYNFSLFEYYNVYFEENNGSLFDSPAVRAYESIYHKIRIEIKLQHKNTSEFYLDVDKRITCNQLKELVSRKLNMKVDDFQMYKSFVHGLEILPDHYTLHSIGIRSDSIIAISMKKYFYLVVYLHNNDHSISMSSIFDKNDQLTVGMNTDHSTDIDSDRANKQYFINISSEKCQLLDVMDSMADELYTATDRSSSEATATAIDTAIATAIDTAVEICSRNFTDSEDPLVPTAGFKDSSNIIAKTEPNSTVVPTVVLNHSTDENKSSTLQKRFERVNDSPALIDDDHRCSDDDNNMNNKALGNIDVNVTKSDARVFSEGEDPHSNIPAFDLHYLEQRVEQNKSLRQLTERVSMSSIHANSGQSDEDDVNTTDLEDIMSTNNSNEWLDMQSMLLMEATKDRGDKGNRLKIYED